MSDVPLIMPLVLIITFDIHQHPKKVVLSAARKLSDFRASTSHFCKKASTSAHTTAGQIIEISIAPARSHVSILFFIAISSIYYCCPLQ